MLWESEGIEITAAITSEHLRPGMKILDGKTRRVKLDRNVIITS